MEKKTPYDRYYSFIFPLKQLTENYKQIKPAEEIDLLNIDSDGACSLILFQVELHDN